MAAYDKAYELAKDLKNSPEYQEYIKVKKEIEAEPMSKKMLVDYMRKQVDIQTRHMRGEKVSPDEVEQFKKLAELAQMNRNVMRYVEAERRIAVLLEDVQRILIEGMEVGFKEIFEGLKQ